MADKEVRYEIVSQLGVISTSPKGWTKEANLMRYSDGPLKLDIRHWAPNREKMGKGIVLDLTEAKELIDILNEKLNVEGELCEDE
jgi:hypothetical protein